MNTQKVIAAAAILAVAGTTFAQVSPGAFVPSQVENYETTGGGRQQIFSLFGGLVSVVPGTVTHNSVNEGDWFDFRSFSPVQAQSGSIFGVQFGFGSFTLDFTSIGGITGLSFWATAAGVGADTVEFFNLAGNPMTGTVTDFDGFGPGDGTMEFLSSVSSTPIGSVRFTGVETCFDDIGISSDGIAPCVDWTAFTFGGLGDVVTFPFEITAGCPTFKITDAFLSGDEFDVRILQGATEVASFSTSEDPTVGDDIGADYDAAFADPRWSSGFVGLDVGSYTAEVTVTASPFGAGGAGWRTDFFLAPPCPVVEGDFDADAIEDYEGTGGGRQQIFSIFDGDVPVIPGTVTHNSVNEGDWFDFRSGQVVQATSGSIFGVQFGFGSFTLDFTNIGGITGFKGNATAAGVGADQVTFFDMDGNELCTFTDPDGFGPGDGTMEAFSYVSDTLIGSVRLTGRETCFDDLGYTQGTECRADCDGDGELTIFDFLCFQNAFDSQDPYADFDGDGLFTIFDFLAFQNEFDAGCE